VHFAPRAAFQQDTVYPSFSRWKHIVIEPVSDIRDLLGWNSGLFDQALKELCRWFAGSPTVWRVLLVLGVLLTGLIGVGCFILGLLLIGTAVWSFLRQQASLDRTLSSISLVAGLLCLAPGLWFLAGGPITQQSYEPLTLTFLVWLVAAGIAIVVGILARLREHDQIARRMAATGLGLSIALTVGWPLAFFGFVLWVAENGGLYCTGADLGRRAAPHLRLSRPRSGLANSAEATGRQAPPIWWRRSIVGWPTTRWGTPSTPCSASTL
jgi:hypothetical protein